MKKYRIMYLIVMTAILICGLWGGGRLAPVLFLLLVILPVFSATRLYLTLGGWSLSLVGEHSCYSGQQMKLKLKMEYPFFRPAGNVKINITYENRVFGTKEETSYLLGLGRGRQHEYAVSLNTDDCGGRMIRIREMVCYDLLNLFSCHKPVDEEFACMVYPYEAQMYIALGRSREREQPGDIYDGKKSGTDVSEVFGLREYREGDSLQSIHWKISGKMGQLIVREFGRPVNYHTMILFAPAFQYGEQKVSRQMTNVVFDIGVSLSRALLNQNMAHFVGYLLGNELHCLPVDSLGSYEEMLMKLMNQPVQKNGDETLIAFINQQLYRQYTKVVYVAGAVNETVAQNLSMLADLTVLQPTEGHSGYLAGDGGYSVVNIMIENVRRGEHMIPL